MQRRKKWLIAGVIAPLFLWTFLAIAFFPAFPFPVGVLLALTWAGLVAGGARLSGCGARWLAATALGIAVIAVAHFSVSPSEIREWIPGQEQTVNATFTGEEVVIENLRNRVFAGDGSVDSLEWYSDAFRIDEVERVDFVHEILSPRGLVAHGFLTFAFSDGRYLAVSVEARRRTGQSYNPLHGLFRNYELIYIVGRETDLIGERANVRRNPVHVYPIRTTPENVQDLFRSVLKRAHSLRQRPEFYNSVTNNCVTNILLHVNELTDRPLRYDLRILFPGLADNLLHRHGLLDFEGSREEARERFRINDRSTPLTDSREWSRQIRRPPLSD